MPKYTVVCDWDSDFDMREAVVFHVVADSRIHARQIAESLSWQQHGTEADHLYDVVVLDGHAHESVE